MVHGSEIANTFYRKIDPPVGGAAPNVYASTDSEAPVLASSCASGAPDRSFRLAGGAAVVFGRDPRDADDGFGSRNDLEGFLHEQMDSAVEYHSHRLRLGGVSDTRRTHTAAQQALLEGSFG